MIADKLDEGFTSLEFEDFLDLMINRVSKKDTRQDIRKIFNLFDEEKTGFITIKTLKKVIKDLGENIDES
jgi:centrin-1